MRMDGITYASRGKKRRDHQGKREYMHLWYLGLPLALLALCFLTPSHGHFSSSSGGRTGPPIRIRLRLCSSSSSNFCSMRTNVLQGRVDFFLGFEMFLPCCSCSPIPIEKKINNQWMSRNGTMKNAYVMRWMNMSENTADLSRLLGGV